MALRLDLAVLLVSVGLFYDRDLAVALLIAVLFHELGHFAVARLLGGHSPLLLQVGGGRAYLKHLSGAGPSVAVLVAGPLAGLIPFTASLYMEYFGSALRDAVIFVTLYQTIPYPPLDGGQILARTALKNVPRTLNRWRILWVVSAVTAVALGLLLPEFAWPLAYASLLAILLARAEAGPMRYADAYEAWEVGNHREVIARTRFIPSYLSEDDTEDLAGLGLAAARAVDDADAMADLAEALPPYNIDRVRVAEYLLRLGNSQGASFAQDALDADDEGRVYLRELDQDVWADMTFHLAGTHAVEGRTEAAVRTLERAVRFGFDNVDRLEADPALGGIHEVRPIIDRLRAPGPAPESEAAVGPD